MRRHSLIDKSAHGLPRIVLLYIRNSLFAAVSQAAWWAVKPACLKVETFCVPTFGDASPKPRCVLPEAVTKTNVDTCRHEKSQ